MSEKTKDIQGLDSNESPTPIKGKNYLLAIGIDDYAHCPKLHNAVKDAKDIVAVLKKRFQFETAYIEELYDQNATKSKIYTAFRKIASLVTPNDNLLIYFSGHGEYDKLFNLGYWIPVDAAKESVDQYVANSEVRNILSAINSHHTFLIVDSCFSGMLFAKSGSRNISLRKERDPSRWGLTAGRNEIVTDGEKGTNSPFAKSILYQLRNTDRPIGVSELCDKVLEVVSANAQQTPRGEPLKVDGHQGGQFVFHLKKDELADWKETIGVSTLAAYQSFVGKYPEGKYKVEAAAKIKNLEATQLWEKIETSTDETLSDLGNRLRLVNQYVDSYEDQAHFDEALNVGESLEYKKQFLKCKDSEFALRRFLKKSTPAVPDAKAVYDKAKEILNAWNSEKQEELLAEQIKRDEEIAKAKAERQRQEKLAAEAELAAAQKQKAETDKLAKEKKKKQEKLEKEARLEQEKTEVANRKAAEAEEQERKRKELLQQQLNALNQKEKVTPVSKVSKPKVTPAKKVSQEIKQPVTHSNPVIGFYQNYRGYVHLVLFTFFMMWLSVLMDARSFINSDLTHSIYLIFNLLIVPASTAIVLTLLMLKKMEIVTSTKSKLIVMAIAAVCAMAFTYLYIPNYGYF